MLEEQDFRLKVDAALEDLYDSLAKATDKYDFEVDFGGALTVEFEEPPAKFVVSPNAPVRQIWVSAHSQSFKLDWDAERNAFVLPESGQTLHELMAAAVGKQLGVTLTL
jgi:CyaY protein